MTATILDMTRDWVDANCERLKALSADLAWDYWDRQHFLRELPGKWTLSRRAEIAGELAGYAIASQKGNWLWLHHLVVAAAHRSSGLGARLLEALETAPCAAEVKGVRLKVGCDNERALAFYLRRGYRQVGVGDAYLGLEKLFPGRAKIVAIHQPNYFPWPGYFNKMLGCDDFVFLDDALTSNNSFINRNRIKQHGAELWLTVPCRQHLSDPINQVGYADNKWPSKHLKTIQQYYSKAPYFNDYFPTLRDILQSPPPKLAALNIKLIQQVADWLDIRCAVHLSSALGAAGSSDERLVDLVQRLHGDVYLSGKGGANYQSEDTFRQRNIRLVYHSFRPPTYPQLGGAFIPGLSILDLLFNCGPAARSFLAASDDATKTAA